MRLRVAIQCRSHSSTTAKALAHILERHYYKIGRHPGTGKFNIPLPDLPALIRDAGAAEPLPVPGSLNLQRVWHAATITGVDQYGQETTTLTVITGPGGNIITGFSRYAAAICSRPSGMTF